jgi:predicted metal-dependent peptidase
MIKNDNLKFFEENSTEHNKYQKTLFYLLSIFVKRDEICFYVEILNNFTYKFIKNGSEHPDLTVGTLYKNQKLTLIINPTLFFKKSEQEMMYTLIHEAEHILNFHIVFDIKKDLSYNSLVEIPYKYIDEKGVEKSFTKKIPLATIAMDLEINSLKYKMPTRNNGSYLHKEEIERSSDFLLKEGIFPSEEKFQHLLPYKNWENYYDKIMDDAKNGKNGFSISKDSGGLTGVVSQKDGVSNHWLSEGNTDGSELTVLDIENLKMSVVDMINFASSKSAGNIPGKYKSFLEDLKKTKYDWKKALSQFIASGLSPTVRISKRKINRRAINKKSFMAGSIAERDVNIVVAIDVSGSISQSQFEAAVSHLNKLRQSTNSKMFIICFDAGITLNMELKKQSYEKVLKTKVGESYSQGGTMFGPVFEAINTEKDLKTADVILFFTDGYNFDAITENPVPRIPLLWVYTPQHQKQNFGNHIIMQDYN